MVNQAAGARGAAAAAPARPFVRRSLNKLVLIHELAEILTDRTTPQTAPPVRPRAAR